MQIVEKKITDGDTKINGVPYKEIVEIAGRFIRTQGGFEKFAEWGLF